MIGPRHFHPESLTFALLLNGSLHRELEDGAQESIGILFKHLSDERKADLYARCVESVNATDSFPVLQGKVSKALWDNQNAFING